MEILCVGLDVERNCSEEDGFYSSNKKYVQGAWDDQTLQKH